MKTNQTTLTASSLHHASITANTRWLNRKNNLLSSLMDETVTNRQALCISNFSLSLVCTMGAVSQSLIFGLLAFGWMVSAYHLLKKGGMTYED